MSGGLPRRGRDGTDPAQRGEGRFGSEPVGVGARGDEQLCRSGGTDSVRRAQRGVGLGDQRVDQGRQLVVLRGQELVSFGEGFQCGQHCQVEWIGRCRAASRQRGNQR